ncbi:MAG: hypothetical protein M5U19_19965 [Microthrixaceae bacterium]|nr:hypothetical protein [Microthrixaceae bacterium]
MQVTVTEDGTFERLAPEIGSDTDDGEGFQCFEGSTIEVPENEGLGVIGPDQPI